MHAHKMCWKSVFCTHIIYIELWYRVWIKKKKRWIKDSLILDINFSNLGLSNWKNAVIISEIGWWWETHNWRAGMKTWNAQSAMWYVEMPVRCAGGDVDRSAEFRWKAQTGETHLEDAVWWQCGNQPRCWPVMACALVWEPLCPYPHTESELTLCD